MTTSDPSQAPPDTSQPAAGASPAGSQPDPTANGSGDCAQIPTATHVVLTAAVTFAVKVPFPVDQANQLPHKFTLTNDDSSYSKTMALASDAKAGDTDGTSVVTFDDLSEHHTYSVQCDDGTSTAYALLENVAYDQLVGDAPPDSQSNLVPPSLPSQPAVDASPASTPAAAPGPPPASSPDPIDPGPDSASNGASVSDTAPADSPAPNSQSGSQGATS